MQRVDRFRGAAVVLLVTVALAVSWALTAGLERQAAVAAELEDTETALQDEYVVLAWNDLGMHCYNANFDELAVLPPYNTLWAQVIRVGDPPQIITEAITVSYIFADNSTSVTKSNFWDLSPYSGVQNAEQLFGLPSPLPDDVGLPGFGLAGEMEAAGDYFIAEGIPLTEFSDSAPGQSAPYQLATVVVQDASTGAELARVETVAPVSSEMHCDYCHYDNGPGNEELSTGVVEQNILLKHDGENMEEYPAGHSGSLMDQRPVLCAWCHSSNALGAPGELGIPSFSNAMHETHSDVVPNTLEGCYNCHPGPQTQCLRDVMSTEYGMDCVDCHGSMEQVSHNPDPWLNEPRCDSAACHGSAYAQDMALYRQSKEHGGVYCEGCHDSTHAIAPSAEPNDAIKFVTWQAKDGPLNNCMVCHTVLPADPGPHGMIAEAEYGVSLEPDRHSSRPPGEQAVYEHVLRNSGNQADTVDLAGTVSMGTLAYSPLSTTLAPMESAAVLVTVTLPAEGALTGLISTAVVTATSQGDAGAADIVTDWTTVLLNPVYLPVTLRQ